jgi:hypothetical protein
MPNYRFLPELSIKTCLRASTSGAIRGPVARTACVPGEGLRKKIGRIRLGAQPLIYLFKIYINYIGNCVWQVAFHPFIRYMSFIGNAPLVERRSSAQVR